MGANNFIDKFREGSENLSVDPSDNLWARLEDKLESGDEKQEIKKLRFLNIAASFALLLGATAFVWMTFFNSNTALAANANYHIEELNIDESEYRHYNQQHSQREEYRKKLFELYGSDKASKLKPR